MILKKVVALFAKYFCIYIFLKLQVYHLIVLNNDYRLYRFESFQASTKPTQLLLQLAAIIN